MKKVQIVLIGLGTVNIGLLRIILEKRSALQSKYEVDFIIVGVADSSGVAINEAGFGIEELIELKKSHGSVSTLPGYLTGVPTEELPKHLEADLLVEGSPVNLQDGTPGLQVVLNAMRREWAIVLANKAPLVLAYDELHEMAVSHEVGLAYSATVCGGLPVINVLTRDLKAATMMSFRGILNSTSNFVLREIQRGCSFEEAIGEAKRLGVAEADPNLDISGQDTANKLFIIMKSFSDFAGSIADIDIEGIADIDIDIIKKSAEKGHKIKLLGKAEMKIGLWKLEVKPVDLPIHSFLGACDGREMGFEMETDLYERISMKMYEEDSTGTSAAVLRDIIDVSEKI